MIKYIKRYLPFGIVIALIYLVMPIFFQGENYKYDAIEYQFVFSLLGNAYTIVLKLHGRHIEHKY